MKMMPNWYGDSMLSPPGAEHRMNTTGKTPEKYNKMGQDLERLNSNQVAAPCSKADLEQAAFRQMTTSKSARSTSPTTANAESSSKVDSSSAPSSDDKKVAAAGSNKKIAAGATTDAKDDGPADRIKVPEDKDVLFGRGRPYQNHPGNRRLHSLVELHRDQYLQSKRFDKNIIAKKIVQMIKTSGGRFLKRAGEEQDYWVVVNDSDAREKVSTILRSKVRSKVNESTAAAQVAAAQAAAAATAHQHAAGIDALGDSNSSRTGIVGPASRYPSAAAGAQFYGAAGAQGVPGMPKALPPSLTSPSSSLMPGSMSSLLGYPQMGGFPGAAAGRHPLLRDSSLAMRGLPTDLSAMRMRSAALAGATGMPYGSAMDYLQQQQGLEDLIGFTTPMGPFPGLHPQHPFNRRPGPH